jgi:hypothetical protein
MPHDDKPLDDRPARQPGGLRRIVATLALTVGLLAVGGVSAVMAASPDPSASTAPAGTSGATGSADTGTTGHLCPAEDSSNATDGSTDNSGSSASPAS